MTKTVPFPRPIQPGDVLDLNDTDYLFGRGSLIFRVLAVHEYREHHGQPWAFLGGAELRADGNRRRLLDILVRPAALRTRRRQPT